MTYYPALKTINSPANIKFLLHAYADGEPNTLYDWETDRDGLEPNPTADLLKFYGLIRWDQGRGMYKTTTKGDKLCEMLCETPLPINVWQDPRKCEKSS